MSKLKDVVEDVVQDEITTTGDEQISHTDPKWVDFIISQLSDHELIEGSPTTDGLRRVTELHYGKILESHTSVISASAGFAVVSHKLTIDRYEDGNIVAVSASVSANASNLPHPFNQHLVATLCTRAEGKALRRALKIRVQTADEIMGSNEELPEDGTGNINDQQVSAIKVMTERTDTNVEKLVKSVAGDKVKTILALTRSQAAQVFDRLAEHQREGTPDKLKGFDKNWEESFGGKKK